MEKRRLLNSRLIKSYLLGLCTRSEQQLVEEWTQKDEEIAQMVESSKNLLSRFCQCRIKSEMKNTVNWDQDQTWTNHTFDHKV